MDIILEKITEGIEYSFLKEFLSQPSKRIRSKLAILYIKALGLTPNEDVYNVLSCAELIHNASLLHDDVIDEAVMRRGETTIGEKFSYKISIVAGDYLLTQSVSKLIKLNNKDVLEVFLNCTKSMCVGEISQYFSRGSVPSEENYLEFCKKKTGELFSATLESCAILLGFDRNLAKRFGDLFGLYFQIKNDLEQNSASQDVKNEIFTANLVLGIEKTRYLLDNCREDMKNILEKFPDSIYKKELEGLFSE